VSLVHYLTIGRFGFREDSLPPNLVDRVVAHFVPGGLQQLGRDTSFVVPFSDGELVELEDEVRRRFDVEVSLKGYLTEDGLLCIQYTGVRVEIAEHVAVVAHDLFGAVAGERGEICDPVHLQRRSEECALQNAERKRLLSIKDGRERIRAVIHNLEGAKGGSPRIPVWIANATVKDVARDHVDELVLALKSKHEAVLTFAGFTLAELGRAAVKAIPGLTEVVRDPTSPGAFAAVRALEAMGSEAEEGLVIALNHPGASVAWTAICALSRLGRVSNATRARLGEVAAGQGEHSEAARKALAKLKA